MGLEEILKQVEETGRDRATAIRKETTKEVESKMAKHRQPQKKSLLQLNLNLIGKLNSSDSKKFLQLN